MDSIFLLNEGDRASFLHQVMHSFGCTYICLWSYFPQPSNILLFMDGTYHDQEINNPSQASSSSGNTLSRTLFNEYRQSVFSVDTSRVPGLAFKNSLPYIEFKQSELSRLAATTTQLQFYQEARIKAAIFMGCKTGEIEIGMPNNSQVNMEMEMKKLFPEDFSRINALSREVILQQTDHQNHASSSSSSLQSFSLDNSPEYSPFAFNINPPISAAPLNEARDHLDQALRPVSLIPKNFNLIGPVQQAIQSLGQIRRPQLPITLENEEAAITKAILAVISSSSAPSPSPSSSSSASHHRQRNVLPPRPTAFKSYGSNLAPTSQLTSIRSAQRHNLFKRSISFLRSLSLVQAQGRLIQQGTRPSSNQLHHMISERRRREKLNESFQSLRSLLPPGTKRDKASVLARTTEYLTSLKARVEELSKKNQMLEAQLLLRDQEALTREISHEESSSERLNVRVTDVGGESTSEESRVVDLRVIVRGECRMLDLVIRLLDFLKQVQNVSLSSVEAETRVVETIPFNRVVLRLRIQGGEWDESSFQEAVRRVVADLAE